MDTVNNNTDIDTVENTVAADLIEQSRLRRAYRHVAAQKILHLCNSLEEERATEVMNTIDSSSLDNLPHWCLLEDNELFDLQRIAGAVFTAPALRRCIDGALLGGWQSLLGAELFEQAITVSAPLELQDSPVLPQANETLLMTNGASVLLSTLNTHPAKALLEKRFSTIPASIPEQTALTVYTLAATLQPQIVHQAQLPNSTAQSAATETELNTRAPENPRTIEDK